MHRKHHFSIDRKGQALTAANRKEHVLTTRRLHLRHPQMRARIGTSPRFLYTGSVGNRQDEASALALCFSLSLLPAGAGSVDTCWNLHLEPNEHVPVSAN